MQKWNWCIAHHFQHQFVAPWKTLHTNWTASTDCGARKHLAIVSDKHTQLVANSQDSVFLTRLRRQLPCYPATTHIPSVLCYMTTTYPNFEPHPWHTVYPQFNIKGMKQSTELHHQQAACTWVVVAKMTLCPLPHVYVSPFEVQICPRGILWVCLTDWDCNIRRFTTKLNEWLIGNESFSSPHFLRQTHIYVHVEKWQDTQSYKTPKKPNTTNTSFTHTTYRCLKITLIPAL